MRATKLLLHPPSGLSARLRRDLSVCILAIASACARTSSRSAAEAGPSPAPAGSASIEQATLPLEGPVAGAPGAPSVGVDPDAEAARTRREALVRSIVEDGTVRSARVLDAMRKVPRHLFVPGAPLAEAYGDWPYPIGFGQTISQPTIVGEMTEALELSGSERVLEIGTGSGYQAAILSVLAKTVYTIEIVPELGAIAKKRLADLGYTNVQVRVGDGYAGWPEQAPFDRVLLTAAPPQLPKALLEQLQDGGVLVAPIGEKSATQWLVRVKKRDGKLTTERLNLVRFVPMVPGR